MLYTTQLPYPDEDEPRTDLLFCGVCNQHVWTRGTPFCIFEPCKHMLLFTDCEGEATSWCDPSLRDYARHALPSGESQPTASEPLGSLSFCEFELLDVLPRPGDGTLYAVRTEGEMTDGLLLSTAPLCHESHT